MWVSRDKKINSLYDIWKNKPEFNKQDGLYLSDFFMSYSLKEWPFDFQLKPGECVQVTLIKVR